MSDGSGGGLTDRATSCISAGIGLVISTSYIVAARRIEDSLLADAVGASGVPVAVGALMALASTALLIKALRPAAPARSANPADSATPLPQTAGPRMRAHGLAAGLLLILTVYLWVLPWLGYIVSIGLLAASVAWLAGGRERAVLLGFALLTGPLLWLLFDVALRVRMPAGFWPALVSG